MKHRQHRSKDDPTLIGVLCKYGKHRSVALSELLGAALKRLGASAQVEHLCRTTWSETAGGVNTSN